MPGLFPTPRRHRGPRELASERMLAAWRHDGHHVDPVTSSALRAAGEACDLAQHAAVDGDSTALSYARAVAIWWQVYREAAPATQATDAVDEALVQLLADADAAG